VTTDAGVNEVSLQLAVEADLDQLTDFVQAFHALEGMSMDEAAVQTAVRPLLDDPELGRIWLIRRGALTVGYIAICYGYSIEFASRDAFVDELYVVAAHRGRGVASAALRLAQAEAARRGVRALHLEVDRSNGPAQKLYESAGFLRREQYFLMTWRVETSGKP